MALHVSLSPSSARSNFGWLPSPQEDLMKLHRLVAGQQAALLVFMLALAASCADAPPRPR